MQILLLCYNKSIEEMVKAYLLMSKNINRLVLKIAPGICPNRKKLVGTFELMISQAMISLPETWSGSRSCIGTNHFKISSYRKVIKEI